MRKSRRSGRRKKNKFKDKDNNFFPRPFPVNSPLLFSPSSLAFQVTKHYLRDICSEVYHCIRLRKFHSFNKTSCSCYLTIQIQKYNSDRNLRWRTSIISEHKISSSPESLSACDKGLSSSSASFFHARRSPFIAIKSFIAHRVVTSIYKQQDGRTDEVLVIISSTTPPG